MRINGKKIKQKMFAYDGCHKIYLLNSEDDKKEALDLDYYILPINMIKDIYLNSCELRFINTWNPLESIVGQYEIAKFEY
jgi:hypothetical protein